MQAKIDASLEIPTHETKLTKVAAEGSNSNGPRTIDPPAQVEIPGAGVGHQATGSMGASFFARAPEPLSKISDPFIYIPIPKADLRKISDEYLKKHHENWLPVYAKLGVDAQDRHYDRAR